MWTISLVILAVSFGGALERCGSVERLFAGLKHMLHRVGTLTGCTLLTSVFCDAVMCDQFLGIGIPAPLYADKYDEMGLARNMLSRTLEDAGTMWSPLFTLNARNFDRVGKTKPGKPAACPDDVRDVALANLEAARAAGKAPVPQS